MIKILPLLFLALPCYAGGLTNPDVTQDNIDTTICKKGWTKTIRPPANYTNRIKKRQIKDLPDTDPGNYQEDHIIALSIGGHPTDERNLEPQLLYGEWNATKKDRLEKLFAKKVCAREMTLQEAQEQMGNDWVNAYKRYFK